MKGFSRNFGMMMVMAVAIMVLSGSASAQGGSGGSGHSGGGHGKQTTHKHSSKGSHDLDDGNLDYGKSHKKNSHGYRNYGQYRSTQVGNGNSHKVHK